MPFSNELLSVSALPEPSQIDFESLDKRFLPMLLVSNSILASVLLVVMSIARFQRFFELPEPLLDVYFPALIVVTVYWLLTCAHAVIATPFKQYCLREHDLHYSSGWVFRKTVSQPISRIQHIELKRGPLERGFGLASLQVFSAGGAMHTFEIPGLDADAAETLRTFVLEHKDTHEHG